MKITNYNELFGLFDKIISANSDESFFYTKDHTVGFRSIIRSYDRVIRDYTVLFSINSFSGQLAALSLGLTSLINSPDKKLSRRYHLSFTKVFPVISSFIRDPQNYYVYNLYPNEEIFIKHDLFVNDVNLAGFYNKKFFIFHNYNEYNHNVPFITLLSPSIMFKDEISCLEFIED